MTIASRHESVAEIMGSAIVRRVHVPPVGLADRVADEQHAGIGHGHIHATGVPAPRLPLLVGAAWPGAHAALGVVDAAFAVIGVVFGGVGKRVVPTEVSRNNAGPGKPEGPGAAGIQRAEVRADADFRQHDGVG